METTDYVSYPLALALKKAGFDWKCHYHYNSDRGSHIIEPNYTANDGEDCQYITTDDLLEDNNGWQYCSAPSLAQAQKWLREEKRLIILVDYILITKDAGNRWCFSVSDTYGLCDTDKDHKRYNSYEAALSAGIAAALELIENEKE